MYIKDAQAGRCDILITPTRPRVKQYENICNYTDSPLSAFICG